MRRHSRTIRTQLEFVVAPCRVLIIVILMGLAGCGKQPATVNDPGEEVFSQQLWPGTSGLQSERPDCLAAPGPTKPGGLFTIALTEEVSAERAPVPHNSSERILFNQLYETLVRVDCEGNLLPGLAVHWACTEDSTTWVFTLRENARMWDGTRVTPEVVKEAWTVNQGCPRDRSTVSPWAWFSAKNRTVTTLDARRLAVQMPEPQAAFPLLMAHPATAVALIRPGWNWPVGSGPGRLRATTPAVLPEVECRPNPHHPDPPLWERLVFRFQPDRDPRDLVNEDFDLLVVRDRPSVEFFQEIPEFSSHLLPWDRLYLVIASPDLDGGGPAWKEACARLDPGRDLTSVTARRWEDIIYPSGSLVTCPQLAGPVAMGRSARREWDLPGARLDLHTLVFQEDDPGAREMAQRLTALAGGQSRAAGLPAEAVSFSLDWQMAGAHLVRIDQAFASRCLQAASLLAKAEWLQKLGLGSQPGPGWDSLVAAEQSSRLESGDPLSRIRSVVFPVGLTRPWLVTRGPLGGWTLLYDGTPDLSGLGLVDEETGPAPAVP